MARIPEEKIEEIRAQTDIVDLIGEYIQLTKRGRNWFGLCPFHGESTPSFSVSEDKQLFHCFGCGASGNAITFVMDLESRSFTESIIKLAERSSIELEMIHVDEKERPQLQFKNMIEAHELAANFYRHILLNTIEGEEALSYLEARGFTREMIEQYGIGWALDDYHALTGLLERKGYAMEEMEQAGLCLQRDDGTGYFDRFRGRVMFPLWDDHGKVIGFSGRLLEKDAQQAKYLNSPETPIFEKNKILYNLHNARLNIRKTGKVILFEGFMDVIAADKSNIHNTVAMMGTSLSETHLVKLKRISKQLVICCDGDEAGWEAANRFAKMSIAHGMDCLIAVLPNNLDPDDYIQQYGAQSFQEQIIDRAHSYMSFMMAYAKRDKNLQYDNDIMQFTEEVLSELATRSSPVERDLYLRQLAQETKVSEEALQQQLLKKTGQQVKERQQQELPVAPIEIAPPRVNKRKLDGTERAEKILLHHIINDGSLFDRIQKEHRDIFFHEDYKTLFILLAAFYEQHKVPDYHRFLETIEDRSLRQLVLEAALFEGNTDTMELEINDCIHHLEKFRIELKIDEIRHQSIEAERNNDQTRALELAGEIIRLRQSLLAL